MSSKPRTTLSKIKSGCIICTSCGYDLNPFKNNICNYCGEKLSFRGVQEPIGKVLKLMEYFGYDAHCNNPDADEIVITTNKPVDLSHSHILAGGIYRVSRMIFVGFCDSEKTRFWITTPKYALSDRAQHYSGNLSL